MLVRYFLLVLWWLPVVGHTAGEQVVAHIICSRFPPQQRQFRVALPPSYHQQAGQQYPVLYLLDGEDNLGYTRAVSDFLAENALMPEVIIVAMHAGATRGRDYLPENSQQQSTAVGQAAVFRKYLTEELMPFIQRQYRVAPLRMLSGHSLGGVFVLDTLTENNKLFQAYFAQSPYLNPTITADLLPRLKKRLQDQETVKGFLYVVAGDEPELEAGLSALEDALDQQADDSLNWKIEHDNSKTHMTTRLTGQYSALELFYHQWPLSQQAILTGKAAGVKAHITELSEQFGYSIRYSEQALAQATQLFLARGDLMTATAMAEIYVNQHAQSPLAHFMLANSLAGRGDTGRAGTAVAQAIVLYEQAPDPVLQPVFNSMKQLQQQLNAKSGDDTKPEE